MQTTIIKIEVIYDRDHGSANRGWYARDTRADGTEEDTQISEPWAEDEHVPESAIRNWAMGFYADPDGMTDAQLQDLRDMIHIKR